MLFPRGTMPPSLCSDRACGTIAEVGVGSVFFFSASRSVQFYRRMAEKIAEEQLKMLLDKKGGRGCMH